VGCLREEVLVFQKLLIELGIVGVVTLVGVRGGMEELAHLIQIITVVESKI
jgi:hypothetical protein